MIHFEKVTPDNFEAVINLRLRDDQIGFLENNLYSLAEAKVFDYLEPRSVYDDNRLIGFMLYYFQPYGVEGLGKQSMIAALEYFREEYPSAAFVELMHYLDNDTGASLYESVGFESTGEVRRTLRPGTDDEFEEELVRRKYY